MSLKNIEVLKQLIHSDVLSKLLTGSDFLKQQNIELLDCQLLRVFPHRADTYFLKYQFHFVTVNGEIKSTAWAELIGNNVETYYRHVLMNFQKQFSDVTEMKSLQNWFCCLPELGLLLRFTDLDECLPGFSRLSEPKKILRHLAPGFGYKSRQLDDVKVEMLGHRPGKRCISRVHYQSGENLSEKKIKQSVMIKLFKGRSDRSQRLYHVMQQLWEQGFNFDNKVRIPQPIAQIDKANLIIMEDVAATQLGTGNLTSANLMRAGHALSKFHQGALNTDKTFTLDDEIDLLNNWVARVGQIFPQYTQALNSILDKVSLELRHTAAFEETLVHRDFYEKQVLLNDDQTILIDFDTACYADPALDMGNFMAHLTLLELQGSKTPENAESDFIYGYGNSASSSLMTRVNNYKRSTLLRLACLYSFWPEWHSIVPQLIKAAQKDY